MERESGRGAIGILTKMAKRRRMTIYATRNILPKVVMEATVE